MARLGPRAKPSSESVKTSKFGLWPNDRVGETIANPSNTLSLEVVFITLINRMEILQIVKNT